MHASVASPSRAGRRSIAGFTLLELFVAMAIVAIGLSLGVPSYQYIIRKQHTDSAMHLLTSFLSSARATAITFHRVTVVCPTDGDKPVCLPGGNWSHGWMMFMDTDGSRQPYPEDVLRHEVAPLHESLLMQSSAARPMVRYLPDGRSAGSNLTISVCEQERLLGEVIVNNTGRARVTHPSGSKLCVA